MRILIVDDNTAFCQILADMLKPFGEAHVANSGDEAIEMLTKSLVIQERYNLVCLDILMPGLDGLTSLNVIRAVEHGFGIGGMEGVKIIMISAIDNNESILAAFRNQCDAYLIKPISKEKLYDQIHKFGYNFIAGMPRESKL